MKIILKNSKATIEIMGVRDFELTDEGVTVNYGYDIKRFYSSKEYDITLKPQWRNEDLLIPKEKK